MSFYRISPQARDDLVEIWTYVAVENFAPVAADRLMDRFLEQFDALGRHPLMGRQRPEFGPDWRLFHVGRYVVFYQPVKSGVEIVRVVHGARNFGRVLGE